MQIVTKIARLLKARVALFGGGFYYLNNVILAALLISLSVTLTRGGAEQQ